MGTEEVRWVNVTTQQPRDREGSAQMSSARKAVQVEAEGNDRHCATSSSTQQPRDREGSAQMSSDSPPEGDGWVHEWTDDKTGQQYWRNELTGEVRWVNVTTQQPRDGQGSAQMSS